MTAARTAIGEQAFVAAWARRESALSVITEEALTGSLADPALEHLARLHPRLCPRQILGVRIGRYAGELLRVEVPRPDKRLLVITEIDGCFADGLSVATGCWLGHRTLQVVDYGKVAATIVDQHTFEAVRVWPNPRARTTAERLVTRAVDRWHAQLEGYQMMPYTDLLKFLPVKVNVSFIRSLVTDVTRLMCPGCGEDILYGRTVLRQGRPLCRSCAGDSYYVPLTFVSKATREEEGSNP